jgi:hypothetical protein
MGSIRWSSFQGDLQYFLFQLRSQYRSQPLPLWPLAKSFQAAREEALASSNHRGTGQPGLLGDRMVRNFLAGQQDHLTLSG